MSEQPTIFLKCEECDMTSDTENVSYYEWPVKEAGSPDGITVCDKHAAENGFCSMCGYFVLGISISDELSLQSNLCCADCLEEIRYEAGEYDDEYDVDFDEDGYPDYDDGRDEEFDYD